MNDNNYVYIQSNAPDFSNLLQSVDKSFATCGDIVTFTVTIPNTGDTTALNVVLRDTLPNSLILISDSVLVNGTTIPGVNPLYGLSLGTIPQNQTVVVKYKAFIKCDTLVSTETITLYKNTSISRSNSVEQKRFNFTFHSFEPLSTEVLQPTDVTILIDNPSVTGTASVYLHDTQTISSIGSVSANVSKTITVPRIGELFLDVSPLQYTPNTSIPFSFNVRLTFKDASIYLNNPTLDIRTNKISTRAYSSESAFMANAFTHPNNGMILISDNIRMYMPLSKYVPLTIQPVTTLNLHEEIVKTYNDACGLISSNTLPLDRPRSYFVLNSPKYVNIGYMSAGSNVIDADPPDSFLFFEPNWGLFHEYGHLYDQGQGFLEISNNLFSKLMAEKTTGFTWLWGTNRAGYENSNILPIYNDFYINNIKRSGGFTDFKIGLYALILFTENLSDFIDILWTYYRNNVYSYVQAEGYSYSIAINYHVNVIPYFEMHGYDFSVPEPKNTIIDQSTSSAVYIPPNPNFSTFANTSVKPTVKGIYVGANSPAVGIANPNALVSLSVGSSNYTVNCNSTGHFIITIPNNISASSVITITSTESGKLVSPSRVVYGSNSLSDNKVVFLGLGDALAASIRFDTFNNKLIVEAATGSPHSYFAGIVYYGFYLYNSSGTLKVSSEIKGDQSSTAFKTALNGQSFADGDYFMLYHKEPSTRLRLYGYVQNSPRDLSTGFATLPLSSIHFTMTSGTLVYSTI